MFKFWFFVFVLLNGATFEELKEKVKDSKDAEILVSHFGTRKDVTDEDEYVDPQTFIDRQAGDCDDFARLVYELLENNGYEVKLYCVSYWDRREGRKRRHAVCSYKKWPDWGIFSNHVRYPHWNIYDYVRETKYEEWEEENAFDLWPHWLDINPIADELAAPGITEVEQKVRELWAAFDRYDRALQRFIQNERKIGVSL